jgi:hypothetical protein
LTIETSDVRSCSNEQIVHAAQVIGMSHFRRVVFKEIHRGKKRIKTVDEIVSKTGLKRINVLKAANYLSNNRIITKTKINGKLAYERDDFYFQNKRKILRLAGNKKALERYPTKRTPKLSETIIRLTVNKNSINIEQITVDDIDSFSEVRKIELDPNTKNVPILEEVFQQGLQKILGETGTFKDWGGETDDLFSTRLILKDKRMYVAFGLKGRGTKGKLTPKKMGDQGDQIQRLFRSPAEVFIVQYWAQISETILEQMKMFATAKSALEGKKIYYGIIDGQDTLRLMKVYKDSFELTT